MRRRWWIWVLVALCAAAIAAVAGFVIWAKTPLGPMPAAIAATASDRVDPLSYAPAMRAIAEEGYLAVVVPMPFNLAVLGSGRAAGVIDDFPDIKLWAVGGHSLGGAMAATFAGSNGGLIEGLVLWAAYPSARTDLSDRRLAVVSVSATNDGLTTPTDIVHTTPLLPAAAEYVAIQGGNTPSSAGTASKGATGPPRSVGSSSRPRPWPPRCASFAR